MSVERLQANLPIVGQGGRMTPTTAEVIEKLMRKIDELETRIAALEP